MLKTSMAILLCSVQSYPDIKKWLNFLLVMVLMFLIWFTAFFLTSYVPEPFTIVSWLWAGGGASLLSYLLMRRNPTDIKFTELPIISLICFLTSLPLLFIKDEQLVLTATFLAFSLSFVTGGLYSILNAPKMLGGEP